MNNKKEIISASPKVRKFAREIGANIYQIKGTKREGRVSEEDVRSFVKERLAVNFKKKEIIKAQEYDHAVFGSIETKPIPRIKKIAGPHLERAWQEIPHVTQHDEADITEMEKFRESLRDLYTGEKIKITPLAFIIRAVVKALKDYPIFNSSLDVNKEQIIYKKYFHIGIAVDTPHGLMVPKIRNVDNKKIKEIGKEIKKIVKLCKELKIDKKEFFGGSITISSLGGIGGSFFTPIINKPEVAILGIGKAETKQMLIGNKYENRIMLPLSLSYDHRIIDGAEGARFCVHLKESLGKDFAYKLAV